MSQMEYKVRQHALDVAIKQSETGNFETFSKQPKPF